MNNSGRNRTAGGGSGRGQGVSHAGGTIMIKIER